MSDNGFIENNLPGNGNPQGQERLEILNEISLQALLEEKDFYKDALLALNSASVNGSDNGFAEKNSDQTVSYFKETWTASKLKLDSDDYPDYGRVEFEEDILLQAEVLSLVDDVAQERVYSFLTYEDYDDIRRLIAALKNSIKGFVSKRHEKKKNEKARLKEEEAARRRKGDSERVIDIKPTSYHEQSGCTIAKIKKDGIWANVPVWDGTAHITKQITSEDSERSYEIEGRTSKGVKFSFTIDAKAFTDSRQLKAHLSASAGASCVFHSNMSRHIAPAIQSISDDAEHVRQFNRVGWFEGEFLIPGATEKTIELPSQTPFEVVPSADLNRGITALEALINVHSASVGIIPVIHMLGAPLARPAGLSNERNALMIYGRTGTFKTTVTKLGMSIYGPGFNDDSKLLRFGNKASTFNALVELAASASDLPFFIDNYKPQTSGGRDEIVSLVHAIIEGSSKNRLHRSGEAKDTKPFHCWPIFTGEGYPQHEASTLARILLVAFPRFSGQENKNLSLAQENADHLPAIGREWLKWIQGKGKKAIEEMGGVFETRRKEWNSYLIEAFSEMANTSRVASSLAYQDAIMHVLGQCAILKDLLCSEEMMHAHNTGLSNAAARMGGLATGALECSMFLDGVRELLATSRGVIIPRSLTLDDVNESRYANSQIKPEQLIGFHDKDGIYLLMQVCLKLINKGSENKLNLSDGILYDQLLEQGKAVKNKGPNSTLVLRCSKQPLRVLHIKPGVIDSESFISKDGNEEQNPA